MHNPYRAQSSINPQKVNGHREINNVNFQALMSARLSGAEYQVVLTVIDHTWGFSKHDDCISYTQFEKATGLSRESLSTALKKAEAKRLIIVEKAGRGRGKGNRYMFNKFSDTWLISQPLRTNKPELISQPLRTNNPEVISQPLRTTSSQPLRTNNSGLISQPPPYLQKKGGRGGEGLPLKETIKERDTDLFNKWELALGELEKSVSRANFRTWLKGSLALSYADNVFTLGVSSGFKADYLEKNQRSLLEKTLSGIYQVDVRIAFKVLYLEVSGDSPGEE